MIPPPALQEHTKIYSLGASYLEECALVYFAVKLRRKQVVG